MAPQHELIRLLASREIAESGCSSRAIKSVHADLRSFSGATAPALAADEFGALVKTSAASETRRVAMEHNANLRDLYPHNKSCFRSYHLVYVDESDCDKRIRFRRTGCLH